MQMNASVEGLAYPLLCQDSMLLGAFPNWSWHMERLAQSTIRVITRCWADHLGCAPEHFQTTRTLALPHLGIGDYHGVFVFRLGQAVVASVPPQLLPTLGPPLEQLDPAQLMIKECVRAVGAATVERVIGPAYYGYADATSLLPSASAGIRLLTHEDAPFLEQLHTACSEAEWAEAGGLTIDLPLVGQFVGGRLVAVAGYHVWWDCLAHMCVITHPACRRHGYGKAVALRLAEVALSRALVPQYRALEVNQASIGIATALGFEHCATSIALRLKSLRVP